ncbi:hypothetical protein LTR85_000566 [Meristemomyces frigidus]|nr:hypothetical protein LTR85_000566 [Meristemomyces frigidus]
MNMQRPGAPPGNPPRSNAPPPIMNPPPQIFGGNTNTHARANDVSPRFYEPQQSTHWFPGDPDYGYEDENGGNADVDIDNDNDGGDSREAKRRRIARACDMCRKKKIKCDGKMPKCSNCENYKTECIFTQVEKKRAPPKGAKYIEGLENRLGRMESLLRLSGLLAEDDGGRTDLGTLEKRLAERQTKSAVTSPAMSQGSAPTRTGAQDPNTPANSTPQAQQISPQANGAPRRTTSPPAVDKTSKGPPKRDGKEVDALADQMCSLITNNCGETRYIGSSSGFSIFSPKGIQWVNQKTGDNSFQHMIASATSEEKQGWDHWKPEVFNDLFDRRIFKPLPARAECFALLKDYFEHFNQMFPLFHEPTFMHLVDRHYSLEPYEGSGWWASLNVALAIAHRLRVMSNVVPNSEDAHAWLYLKNAMAVMPELTMRNTDLLSVQALLGMALFLQGTPNPQPSFFLVAAAIRLAHSIGLHKRGAGFNLNAVENEQRKRVFWIAYLLDKDICLRSGRPPAQDDDDMNVELPSESPADNVGNIPLGNNNSKANADKSTPNSKPSAPASNNTMNLFRLNCTFAQIQSRVYKNLYSVTASRQSDGELLNTIGTLDSALEEWKDSIPLDFRPEQPTINSVHTPLILHVVVLHFAYYNCLTTIHRMSVHHGYWTDRLSCYMLEGRNARPLNPRVFMSAALCVNAARTSIGLIRYIPQGDYACVWLILYYPVSALVTLFANILQNPQDARARSDLKLMSSVVSFLTMLERDVTESNGNVRRMLSVCAEFERIAKVVLDKAERDMRSGRSGKRKANASGGGNTGSNHQHAHPPTQKEVEKAMRDRGVAEAALAAGLDEGKTLEQIQVETQAAYRRPVQTPSLRASIAGGSQGGGSGAGASPASWGGSQPGGTGPEYRSPPQQGMQGLNGWQQQMQNTSGQWDAQPVSQPLPFSMPDGAVASYAAGGMANGHSQQLPPADFTQPQRNLADGYEPANMPNTSNAGFSPTFPDPNSMMMNGNGFEGNSFDTSPNIGSFQQPFVPQDLWQMPMTLEWDWAEGLGLGSFTPGPLMGGFDGAAQGGFMGGIAEDESRGPAQ